MATHKILLILTGGTICSFDRGDGERASDTHRAEALIVQKYKECFGDSVSFDTRFTLNILSENMTVSHWNTLLNEFRTLDLSERSPYDGIIVLHGTDTLAYTASLLSLVLSGAKIPVLLVSAQLPLTHSKTNGNENFRAAVALIEGGLAPSVYAVYRNSDGVTYLHLGAHLRQCENFSDDFFSVDMTPLSSAEFCPMAPSAPLLGDLGELTHSVLRIEPYVGLDYSHFSLEHVRAVLHGVYHSGTVATFPDGNSSLLSLLRRCREQKIPVFLSPCDKHTYAYETTGEVLRAGAVAISRMTPEMTYAKLLVGLALSLSGDDLEDFLKEELCGEFIL
ncbi:MAG: asparaginase [Clostridia bacterium]|nr:asparaginase [Clostridia bacterium]